MSPDCFRALKSGLDAQFLMKSENLNCAMEVSKKLNVVRATRAFAHETIQNPRRFPP